MPQVTDVIVSIGGGGLMGGVATAVKSPEAGREGVGSRNRGRRLHVEIDRRRKNRDTRCDHFGGANPGRAGALRTDVRDGEEASRKRHGGARSSKPSRPCGCILERLKVLTEPAASCTLAAAERLRDKFTSESHVVLVLCGGNMPLDDLPKLIAG